MKMIKMMKMMKMKMMKIKKMINNLGIVIGMIVMEENKVVHLVI